MMKLIQSFDNISEDLNKDYFENCPKEFIGIIESLHFNFNEYKDTYKKIRNIWI